MSDDRAPCTCHGSWPLHADDQAAALRALGRENDRLRAAAGQPISVPREAKRELMAERNYWQGREKARAARRGLARRQRQCFWTRPLGHVWSLDRTQDNSFDEWYRCDVPGCGAMSKVAGY